MLFTVLSSRVLTIPSTLPKAFLIRDNWDDWFEFSTLFSLIIFDEGGERHDPGGVKIGQFGMQIGQRSPQIPDEFDSLDQNFFSLGQEDVYYESLKGFSTSLREQILIGLRDVVADLPLFDRALEERVTKVFTAKKCYSSISTWPISATSRRRLSAFSLCFFLSSSKS